MKGIKRILFTLILLIPFVTFAAGSVTVNKTSLSIENGKTATFTVTANNSAGKVTFKSNNTGVATINKSSEWVEKGSTTVTVTGKSIGSTTITVVVDAATFDEVPIKKTYTIKVDVTNPKSKDNNLSSLSVSGGSINFNKNTTSYSMKVEHNVSSVTINANASDSKAKVSGTGTKNLKDYTNTLNVVVTAENGSKKTYTIKVIRKDANGNYGALSKDNNLKSLKVEGYDLTFKEDKTTYDLIVGEEVEGITINAVPSSSAATVSITGNENLKAGDNEVKVNITAENGEVKSYTINVFKKGEVKEDTNNTSKEDKKETKNNDNKGTKEDKKTNLLSFNIWTIIALILFILNAILLVIIKKLNNKLETKKKK